MLNVYYENIQTKSEGAYNFRTLDEVLPKSTRNRKEKGLKKVCVGVFTIATGILQKKWHNENNERNFFAVNQPGRV